MITAIFRLVSFCSSATLWYFNIAVENVPIIDQLPIDNGDFPVRYVKGGLKHFLFFHILGTIFPTDEVTFSEGLGSTTNQYTIIIII